MRWRDLAGALAPLDTNKGFPFFFYFWRLQFAALSMDLFTKQLAGNMKNWENPSEV
jgi:hypothetical protein